MYQHVFKVTLLAITGTDSQWFLTRRAYNHQAYFDSHVEILGRRTEFDSIPQSKFACELSLWQTFEVTKH